MNYTCWYRPHCWVIDISEGKGDKEKSKNSLHSFQICCREKEVLGLNGLKYIMHSDYVCLELPVILVRRWMEFMSFDLSDTYTTSPPSRFARLAGPVWYSRLGTRKCCWVHRAWRAGFRDDWQSHVGPWKRHRQFGSASCRWTTSRSVLVDLKQQAKEFQYWKAVAKMYQQWNWNCFRED